MATVEFDDYGFLWDPDQLANALKAVQRANDSAGDHGAVVFAYVHGWHHSALSSNRADFMYKLVAPFAADESIRTGGAPRPIVAIYFAWRGALLKGFVDNWPRWYYNRDTAATRVASGDMREALLAVLRAARKATDTRSIVIGHSMGGLILERSLLPTFETWLQTHAATSAGPTDFGEWERLADLVIMINPAAPAVSTRRFKLMLDRWKLESATVAERYGGGVGVPLLVNITSEGDWATSAVMHKAHKLRTLTDNFGEGGGVHRAVTAEEEKQLVRFGAGFTESLLTHAFIWEQISDPKFVAGTGGADLVTTCAPIQNPVVVPRLRWLQRVGAISSTPPATFQPNQPQVCFEVGFDRFRLLQLDGADPFWVFRVPRGVMPSHSEIFTPQMNHLIRGVIVITGAAGPSRAETAARNAVAQTTMLGTHAPLLATARMPSNCTPPRNLGVAFRTPTCSGGTRRPTVGECVAGQEVAFEVVPADAADDACLTFTWAFSDGTDSGARVTRTLASDGRAVLTATDDVGYERTAMVFVLGGDPAERVVTTPPETPVIQVSCGDRCRAEEDVTFTVTNARPGDVVDWNFGGSSMASSGPAADVPESRRSRALGTPAKHVFASGGTHLVTATVSNPAGSAAATQKLELPVPISPVRIRYGGENCDSERGCPSETVVVFSVEPPASADDIEWTLPDRRVKGTTVEEKLIAPGPLRVAVAVRQPQGTALAEIAVPVSEGPVVEEEIKPVCQIDFIGARCTATSCPDGTPIVFSLKCDGPIAGPVQWSFDDGAVRAGSVVTHVFASSGTHEVLATVTGLPPLLRRVVLKPVRTVRWRERKEKQ